MSQTGTYKWDVPWLSPPRDSAQPRRRRKGKRYKALPDQQLYQFFGTYPLSVPRIDWVAITSGEKREFRRYKFWQKPPFLPRPIVIYSVHSLTGEYDVDVAIFEDSWEEPLGVITPESLANEGYDSVSEFRSYFQERYPRRGWRPLDRVVVYKLRPFTEDDRRENADMIFDHLFGRWI